MAKIPVFLEPEKWGHVITAIAMQNPLVAEISVQIAQYNQTVAKANGEADATQGLSEQSDTRANPPWKPAAEPQADRSHSAQQRTPRPAKK